MTTFKREDIKRGDKFLIKESALETTHNGQKLGTEVWFGPNMNGRQLVCRDTLVFERLPVGVCTVIDVHRVPNRGVRIHFDAHAQDGLSAVWHTFAPTLVQIIDKLLK